ncbi:MAG: D-glycero-beta-D-manno-heptose 1,7-bisphosphate 7-phosphatase [Candidatus Aureabacteria bacterium]|nr:D-glycero-beta-D-manno-heptose 1,7-bisphosphate 7-phosphatase [Candidatus Auribacterota bacterium]
MRSAKAVFFDRDGTLNPDPGYINEPNKFEFYKGAKEALKNIYDIGYKIFVITNQSGVGRGLVKEDVLEEIHQKLVRELEAEGVEVAGVYYCPHHPGEKCNCRKPSPEMVRIAVREHGIDVARSFFIGDKRSDIETGKRAGCKTILVKTGEEGDNSKVEDCYPDYVISNIEEAVEILREAANGEAEM